ncbi:MAG: phosphoglucosamine mutase [Clostridia bacterium]|nr:phosphoglucosamine mutase [Clostridia bacterium]
MGRLFGTDGVRGIANTELTCELAFGIGKAAALVLTKGGRRRPVVLIGSDTRASSDMLDAALTAGLCAVGADVIRLGVIPTPAVAFLVGKYKADAGIMISASHNPAEYNGIKLFSGDGYKLPDALEEEIEQIVLDGDGAFPAPIGGEIGRVSEAPNAAKDYIDHLKSTVLYALDGMHIAVDCANGAASATAPRLFEELHAKAEILSHEPDGVNINRDCGSTHLEALSRYVVEHGLDLGVAFDGDADRCLCVDENGEEVDGDQIMAICAIDMKERGKLAGDTVVGTVMTNFGFTKFCKENDLQYIATKVGDRYVLEELLLGEFSFGGEQSGHIIFRDFATTGDGQLTAIQLLSYLKRSGAKLSELKSIMTKYPQLTINLEISAEGKVKFYTNSAIKKAMASAKKALDGVGRIVVRPSGTEPLIRVMAEGDDPALVKEQAEAVASVIREQLQ